MLHSDANADTVSESGVVVLPNGLTVLVRSDRSAPVVAIVTYVKAGYFDEPDDRVGIAHVLEHMYFKGTPTRGVGEIARETKASGGYLNAHTIYDHTSYYTVLPSAKWEDGLAIQADAYAHSLIDADELAREIEVIIQEVHRKEDSPPAVATESLYELLYDRHRMRRWRIGRPEQLRTFDRDRVLYFYRNHYRPGNTILSIVGDVDPDEVMCSVERHYGALPDAPVATNPGPAEGDEPLGARYREWGGDVAQTQIVLGWRTVPPLHPDSPLLDLAATVLGSGRGSRLYRAVRERQLASSVSAYDYTPTELGVFVVQAAAPPERAGEAARAIRFELARLRDHGVPAHELARAQRLLESRAVRRTESMEGQASFLAEWQALGDWSLGDRYLQRALAATPTEVTDAVRRYISLQDLGVVVYRPTGASPLATSPEELLAPRSGGPIPAEPSGPRLEEAVGAANGPRPQFERELGGVRVYRTATGTPILVRRKLGAQVLHAGVYAFGGVRDEGAPQGGLTTLMARAALKGAAGRTAAQLADAIEMLGGAIGATVGSEHFGWTLSVPVRYGIPALAILGDVVQRPMLEEGAVDTERALAVADLATLRDDMYRYPVRLAAEAAYGDHPYGTGSLGTEVSLGALSFDDVREWHAARVLDGPAVLVAVGDVDEDEMAAVAARMVSVLRPAGAPVLKAPVWPNGPVSRAAERDKAQTALALAFPAPARGDDDRTAAELIAGVASGLGGRFFDELRDRRSLAYTVHAFTTERTLAGMFVGYIATSPDKETTARAGLLDEFAKLVAAGVSTDELARAQAYAIGSQAIGRQSGATVLGEVLDAWLFGRGLEELDDYAARIRAVTREDIQRVAAQYFDPARVAEGVVRGR